MDVSLLKTFLSVARTRHFGKTAEILFVTQSAVSARIKLLESRVGIQLFTRDRNNIQLTAAGERLRKHAELIVSAWERARLDIALKSEFTQSLAVGMTIDLWQISVRDWIDQLYAARTDLVLHLEMARMDFLIRRVLDSVLDLAFVYDPPTTSDLVARQVTKITLVLVSSVPSITTEMAFQENYLLVDRGRSFSITHASFVEDRCVPRAHCSSGSMALDLLLSRGGSCYLAQQMVEPHLAASELYPVAGAPVIERHSYAVFRTGNENTDLIQSILRGL